MSDSEKDPLSSLLSSFALGPSWARATGGQQDRIVRGEEKPRRDPSRGDPRDSDDRKGGFRNRERDDSRGRGSFRGKGGYSDDRRNGPPRVQETAPAEGVRVTLMPDAQAVHLIGKEVHQVARVYPLFDVAKILLAERGRCRAVFEAPEPHPPLFKGRLDESLFLTREEAVRHLWNSELKQQFIEEELIEVDPPSGNFQSVAKCGLTGMWLGPPNFHTYQVNLRRLHRECFPNMPFAAYSAKVRTERGEEAVNAWLETMKKRVRWRLKGDAEDAWIEDRADAERALANRFLDEAFETTRRAEVTAAISPKNLSASLLVSLQMSGNHARNHPAILIPAVCKAVEAEHLPVFKRQGKLFTGPARPHPLPPGQALAERPAIIVEWIRANKPAKLEGLWKAVLPEGSSAPPAEYAADLFWLLHQGHILLFTDDTLVVQEIRETPAPDPNAESKSGKKKKKKKNKKPQGEQDESAVAETEEAPAVSENAETAPSTEEPSPANEAPIVSETPESPVTEEVQSSPSEEVSISEPVTEVAEPAPEVPASSPSEEEKSKNPSAGVDEPSAL